MDLETMRHSAAHVMAEAVQSIFPDAKFAIGPSIEEGFYYDFDLPRSLTPDDLGEIEQRMKEIEKADAPFVCEAVTREQAKEMFADQPFKQELIDGLPEGENISIYRQSGFVDLCRGPHVESTSKIGHVKLLNVAGAYWRGDERKPMLQRIYGTTFPTEEELQDYLHRREEAERRDHRRLAKDLDLYSVHDIIGPGLIHWHPKGGMIRYQIEEFWRQEHLKRGYQLVFTPHIASEKVYEMSGHLGSYDAMYSPMMVDEQAYRLKPMNCPGHIMIYKSHLHSYRELPIRYAELGTVYRYERSGVLHGMLRVRGFTQDDSHIFCTPEQSKEEIIGILNLVGHMMSTFGFSYKAYLSTRPEKSIGTAEMWEQATNTLREALEERELPYVVDPGEGVFYGPKIDIKVLDAIGREWQTSTIQLDFNEPDRFDVNYIADDGQRKRVVMLHRTVLGSMERFVGVLTEHYGGAFPVWLAPVQAVIVPIADRHLGFAQSVYERMRELTIRAEVDSRPERMNLKIREAQLQKVPYMLIIGDREAAADSVSVRTRAEGDLGAMPVESVISRIVEEINTKAQPKELEPKRSAD
jgi:threonyl-tRNA synthetase